jgi:hypothetical protein
MSLAYESVAGLPGFIRRVVNRLSVQPISEHRCRVCSHAAFELRGPVSLVGPLFIWRMRVNATRVLDELRHYLEHGQPHPRKQRILARC